MTHEFEAYKSEIMRKTTGANIHKITGLVGSIGVFYELIEQRPENAEKYTQAIENGKAEIYRTLNNKN